MTCSYDAKTSKLKSKRKRKKVNYFKTEIYIELENFDCIKGDLNLVPSFKLCIHAFFIIDTYFYLLFNMCENYSF